MLDVVLHLVRRQSATARGGPSGDPTAALLALLAAAASSPAPAGGGRVAGRGRALRRVARRPVLAVRTGPSSATPWRRTPPATARRSSPCPTTTTPSGSTNADDAERAIDCLDHPVSPRPGHLRRPGRLLKASAPVFGPLLAWGEAGCAVWPAPPTRPVGPVAAAGCAAHPRRRDDERPGHALRLGGERGQGADRGVLLTCDGDDHVAYFYSACVRDVQTYLVSGPSGTIHVRRVATRTAPTDADAVARASAVPRARARGTKRSTGPRRATSLRRRGWPAGPGVRARR